MDFFFFVDSEPNHQVHQQVQPKVVQQLQVEKQPHQQVHPQQQVDQDHDSEEEEDLPCCQEPGKAQGWQQSVE